MKIVVDTSVLLNFLLIGRADLIGSHPFTFVTTGEVAAEILNLRARYEKALSEGHVEQLALEDGPEAEMFSGFRALADLGPGERSAIAIALNRGHGLSLDDRRAINQVKRITRELGKPLVILRTRDIVVDLIRCGELSVEQADSLLAEWAGKHKFRLKISSFSECMADDRER